MQPSINAKVNFDAKYRQGWKKTMMINTSVDFLPIATTHAQPFHSPLAGLSQTLPSTPAAPLWPSLPLHPPRAQRAEEAMAMAMASSAPEQVETRRFPALSADRKGRLLLEPASSSCAECGDLVVFAPSRGGRFSWASASVWPFRRQTTREPSRGAG